MISERVFHAGGKWLRRWAYPGLLACFVLALAAAGPAVAELLRYQRDSISHGEWYRLLTGNLVHLDLKHALLNCAGLLLLPLLSEEVPSGIQWILRIVMLSLGVSLGLYLFEPNLEWYVGLSGVLHGLFVLALGRTALRGDPVAGQVLLILVGKVVWEHYHGPLQFSQAMVTAPVIVAAHTYGIIAALIYAPLAWLAARWIKEPAPVDTDSREKD